MAAAQRVPSTRAADARGAPERLRRARRSGHGGAGRRAGGGRGRRRGGHRRRAARVHDLPQRQARRPDAPRSHGARAEGAARGHGPGHRRDGRHHGRILRGGPPITRERAGARHAAGARPALRGRGARRGQAHAPPLHPAEGHDPEGRLASGASAALGADAELLSPGDGDHRRRRGARGDGQHDALHLYASARRAGAPLRDGPAGRGVEPALARRRGAAGAARRGARRGARPLQARREGRAARGDDPQLPGPQRPALRLGARGHRGLAAHAGPARRLRLARVPARLRARPERAPRERVRPREIGERAARLARAARRRASAAARAAPCSAGPAAPTTAPDSSARTSSTRR